MFSNTLHLDALGKFLPEGMDINQMMGLDKERTAKFGIFCNAPPKEMEKEMLSNMEAFTKIEVPTPTGDKLVLKELVNPVIDIKDGNLGFGLELPMPEKLSIAKLSPEL